MNIEAIPNVLPVPLIAPLDIRHKASKRSKQNEIKCLELRDLIKVVCICKSHILYEITHHHF